MKIALFGINLFFGMAAIPCNGILLIQGYYCEMICLTVTKLDQRKCSTRKLPAEGHHETCKNLKKLFDVMCI